MSFGHLIVGVSWRALQGSILLAALALLLSSCAGNPAKNRIPSERDPVRVLNVHSGADSIRVLEMAAILQIIDPDYYDRLPVFIAEDSLRELLELHQHFNRDTWRRSLENLEYCRMVCETPIYTPDGVRDARWRAFILSGPPAVRWVTQTMHREGGGSPKRVDCFLYTWRSGEGVTLRSDTVGGYPVVEVVKREMISEAFRPIFPVVDYTAFPNPDGSYDVGISVWILGDQLNQASLEYGILDMEARLFRGGELIARDSIRAKLDAMREMLLITPNARELATMGYFSFPEISSGDYTVEFRVSGGHGNGGGFHLELPVPSPRVTGSASDLIMLTSVPSGDVLPGIMRRERSLYANPLWILRRHSGETIAFLPYIEFDPAGNSHYQVEVSLTPVPVRSGRGRGVASTGALRYVSNADGTVYPAWASPIEFDDDASLDPDRSEVIFTGAYSIDGGVGVFNERVRSGKVRRGEYWLRLSIRDPAGNPLGSALTKVEIR